MLAAEQHDAAPAEAMLVAKVVAGAEAALLPEAMTRDRDYQADIGGATHNHSCFACATSTCTFGHLN